MKNTMPANHLLYASLVFFMSALCLGIFYLMQPALFSPLYPLWPAALAALLVVIAFSQPNQTP
ncbi:MAG: hypothetical protein HYZ63_00260 [Candidatus Andersenbacteria bacterium]|nr:hypothetical protein [Candidatus Andersenbacteria bacterium]